jgi:cytochrome c-type biogenesis protein CcmF
MTPMDGQGLNPLLQNPWMVIHPPVMFIGYASLGIPFAFAIAALWMQRYDEWTKVSMPWVLLSLGSLGTAIMLGGYWAYETLGWGGYWGWDPVENASLVPWLATLALTHGMLLQRGRGRFRRLNLVLAIASFLLVVYATFLTRSGVLADFSVHSFVDLGITGMLVFNMGFFLLMSVGLLLYRWREIPAEVGDEPFISRTIFFVVGILLTILIGVVVLFGTSAPLISRLWGAPAQVGPDFYNRITAWASGWRSSSPSSSAASRSWAGAGPAMALSASSPSRSSSRRRWWLWASR